MFELTAARRARGPRPSVAGMLAALAAGRLRGDLSRTYADPPRTGIVGAEVGPAGARCSDARQIELPALEASTGRRVSLSLGGDTTYDVDDLLRTRCAGPGRADLIGSRPLAGARLPLRAFAAERLTVALTPPAPLGGAITVELRRAETHVTRTRR